MFNGKINYKSPFSMAMLNYQRVPPVPCRDPVTPGRIISASWGASRRFEIALKEPSVVNTTDVSTHYKILQGRVI